MHFLDTSTTRRVKFSNWRMLRALRGSSSKSEIKAQWLLNDTGRSAKRIQEPCKSILLCVLRASVLSILQLEMSYGKWKHANKTRRSGQSVTASDLGSNGPRFESGRGRCVESLDKGSLLPLSQGEAFTLASISYLAILVKYILAKKKKKTQRTHDEN